MKNSLLLTLLEETKLSPERLAEHMGISNMTIRRLALKPGHLELPKLYSNALAAVIYDFMAKGIILPTSKLATEVIKEHMPTYYDVAVKNLDIPKDLSLSQGRVNQENIIFWLSKLGSDKAKEKEVDKNINKISAFKNWGKEWSFRITTCLEAIRSKKLSLSKRLSAYGALFYLICPMDLIPDTIPVIGYMDDFLILGLVVAYILSDDKVSKLPIEE